MRNYSTNKMFEYNHVKKTSSPAINYVPLFEINELNGYN